jgi:hypothetical protein
VAREKMYLAQVEALPLERIQGFVRESVAAGAAQFVAIDGPLVVGWCDIFQLGPTPFSTAVRLEWGSCRTIAVGE